MNSETGTIPSALAGKVGCAEIEILARAELQRTGRCTEALGLAQCEEKGAGRDSLIASVVASAAQYATDQWVELPEEAAELIARHMENDSEAGQKGRRWLKAYTMNDGDWGNAGTRAVAAAIEAQKDELARPGTLIARAIERPEAINELIDENMQNEDHAAVVQQIEEELQTAVRIVNEHVGPQGGTVLLSNLEDQLNEKRLWWKEREHDAMQEEIARAWTMNGEEERAIDAARGIGNHVTRARALQQMRTTIVEQAGSDVELMARFGEELALATRFACDESEFGTRRTLIGRLAEAEAAMAKAGALNGERRDHVVAALVAHRGEETILGWQVEKERRRSRQETSEAAEREWHQACVKATRSSDGSGPGRAACIEAIVKELRSWRHAEQERLPDDAGMRAMMKGLWRAEASREEVGAEIALGAEIARWQHGAGQKSEWIWTGVLKRTVEVRQARSYHEGELDPFSGFEDGEDRLQTAEIKEIALALCEAVKGSRAYDPATGIAHRIAKLAKEQAKDPDTRAEIGAVLAVAICTMADPPAYAIGRAASIILLMAQPHEGETRG